jgi:dihydropteroate synthase
MILSSKGRKLDLASPQIMGILNVTPDSFSDGARYQHLDKALHHAEQMIRDGATIIDIGGESTRPGADEVSLDEELSRVIPVIERLTSELDVWLSVDTYKTAVMDESIRAGVHLINDICALQEPGALQVVAGSGVPVCLMHMQGKPRTMQQAPHYEDLCAEVYVFFEERINTALMAGIKKDQLILDPGFGFGKTLEQNYELLGRLDHFHTLGLPLLVGMSRKSMIGQLLDRPVAERTAGSIAAALFAVQQGASIIRVHDVKETADALRVFMHAMSFERR